MWVIFSTHLLFPNMYSICMCLCLCFTFDRAYVSSRVPVCVAAECWPARCNLTNAVDADGDGMVSRRSWLSFRSVKSCRRHSGALLHTHLSSANPDCDYLSAAGGRCSEITAGPRQTQLQKGEIQKLWCQLYACQTAYIHYMRVCVCVWGHFITQFKCQPASPLCHPSATLEKTPQYAARRVK